MSKDFVRLDPILVCPHSNDQKIVLLPGTLKPSIIIVHAKIEICTLKENTIWLI